MPKNFVGGPFILSSFSGIEKNYASVSYVTIFRRQFTVPETFVGAPFSLSFNSGIEKIYASEGYVLIFRRNFFVSQYRNIS